MTSRHRSGLPTMPATPALPAYGGVKTGPALAVIALAAFLSVTMLAGRAGAAHRVLAAKVTTTRVTEGRALPSITVLPDVSSAIDVSTSMEGGDSAVARPGSAASRALARVALHRWVRPYGGVFTSPFGYRWGRLHAGVDLAGPWGSTIVAATDGCIEYAGPEDGYGEVMKIRDWDGTETVYGHMSSFIRTSGCVSAGDPIARIGAGGDATGPHLHFEVRINGVPVDPVPFLAARGVYI